MIIQNGKKNPNRENKGKISCQPCFIRIAWAFFVFVSENEHTIVLWVEQSCSTYRGQESLTSKLTNF